jgi:molybdate transport system substrate-binding protein
MSVIEALGIAEHLGPKLRVFPSGTIAMRELATDRSTRALGCTQATEIVSVPGLVLAGPLPNPHGLATVYTAGLCTKAAEPEAAQRLIAMLCAEETRALRAQAGFEPA